MSNCSPTEQYSDVSDQRFIAVYQQQIGICLGWPMNICRDHLGHVLAFVCLPWKWRASESALPSPGPHLTPLPWPHHHLQWQTSWSCVQVCAKPSSARAHYLHTEVKTDQALCSCLRFSDWRFSIVKSFLFSIFFLFSPGLSCSCFMLCSPTACCFALLGGCRCRFCMAGFSIFIYFSTHLFISSLLLPILPSLSSILQAGAASWSGCG